MSPRQIVLVVLLLIAVGFLFLPFEAGTDLIKVKCGNTFSAIAGFDPNGFVEITEGAENLAGSSAAQVQGAMVDARDACRLRGWIRLGTSGVIAIVAIVMLLKGRRPAVTPPA
jgi:hypothetical protein